MFSSDIIQNIVSFTSNLNLRLVSKAFAEYKYYVGHTFKSMTRFIKVIKVFNIYTFSINGRNIKLSNKFNTIDKFLTFISKKLINCKIFQCRFVELVSSNIPKNCVKLMITSGTANIDDLPKNCESIFFACVEIKQINDLINIKKLKFSNVRMSHNMPMSLPNCTFFYIHCSNILYLPLYLPKCKEFYVNFPYYYEMNIKLPILMPKCEKVYIYGSGIIEMPDIPNCKYISITNNVIPFVLAKDCIIEYVN